MENQTELNAKIELLKKEFEVKNNVLNLLGDIKHNVISIDSKSPFISIDIENTVDLKTVLSKFPAISKTREIGSERDSYHTVLNTPYQLTLENPASPNQDRGFSFQIKYQSEGFEIWIKLPQKIVSDFCVNSQRKPTDSEQHYFLGVSQRAYNDMRVMCYKFEGYNNCINWYGGNTTLTDSDKVIEIMNFLTK